MGRRVCSNSILEAPFSFHLNRDRPTRRGVPPHQSASMDHTRVMAAGHPGQARREERRRPSTRHRTELQLLMLSVHGKPDACTSSFMRVAGGRHRISCECGSSEQCQHCSPRSSSITGSSLVWIQRKEDKGARGWLCSIMRRYSPIRCTAAQGMAGQGQSS